MTLTSDIKTKDRIRGTIKSIDRASIASERMKNAYAKTKEMSIDSNQSSPSFYAEDQISYAGQRGLAGAAMAAEIAADVGSQQALRYIKTRTLQHQTARERAVQSVLTNKEAANSLRGIERYGQTRTLDDSYKATQREQIYNFGRKRSIARLTGSGASKSSEHASKIESVASRISKSVRALMARTKTLLASLSAGGIAAIIIVIICIMFGAVFYLFGDDQSDSYLPVSAEVEAYTPIIRKYAKEYGIGEYVELIKAIMMQESRGLGGDPMQASESGYNKKYSREPGSITDPEYSIQCGVQAIASALKQAKVSSPVDMDRIKLALQSYNFGNGYISWAVSKYGGYSKANAELFSKQQAEKLGWSSYGDTSYVEHVLRYYPYGNYTYDVVDTGPGKLGLPIKGMTKKNITSHFGPRSSPGGIGSTNHQGLDIGFPTGTHVLACEAGTVTTASWYGGLGKCVIIDHGNGIKTVYGHLSKINAKVGQKVVRGQYIGNVGETGNATGPHLHLGVMKNGKFVNPEKGWVSLP